jgi:hypothetical protein
VSASHSVPFGTVTVLAHRALASATGQEFVDWAMRALVDEFDSPALRRLAALDLEGAPSLFEAGPLFARAVEELGLKLPASKEEILRAYLRTVARGVLDGSLTTEDALHIVHTDVLGPLAHPPDLMDWCYLWEGLDPETFATLDQAGVERATRDLAKRTAVTGET